MAEISKQALKVQNNTEFPNNNAGAITPTNLRTFNVNMIDSLVDELSYNVDSGSWNQQIDALEQFTASASGLNTGSLLVTASAAGNTITFRKGDSSTFNVVVATGSIPDISNLNQATASLQAFTASAQTSINNLNSTTASLNSSVTQLNANTASQQISIDALNVSSASQQTSINNLNGATGSYATTGSNTFVGANIFTSISASSFVSASQFVGDGSKITGITASIALPILDEGIPQGNAFSMNFTGSAISAIVVGGTAVVSVNVPDTGSFNSLTASFNSYTASTDADLAAIHQATASLQSNSASVNTSISALNTFTASQSTASIVTSIDNLNTFSASALVSISNLNTNSASVNTSITNVNSATASLFTSVNNINTFTQSAQTSINALNGATASYANSASVAAVDAAQQQSINSLNAATSSYVTSAITASSLVTASFDNGTRNLTFTKGDATTFNVNIPDISGSTINTGSFATTGSNVFVGEQIISSSLIVTNAIKGTGSIFLQPDLNDARTLEIYNTSATDTHITASGGNLFLGNDETYVLVTTYANQKLVTIRGDEKITASGSLDISGSLTASLAEGYTYVGNASGRTQLVATSSFGGATPAGTISGSAQITALGFVSSSVTASSLVTASFSGNTLTFTKGDASTFGVVIPDVSGSAATTIYDTVYTGESITKGDPLYISGAQGANPIVFKADASNPAKMPVTYVSNETIGAGTTTEAIILGHIEGVSLTGYTAGQTIYVAEGGGWSASLPSGSNSVTQLLGVITKGGSGGKGLVLNPGPAQLPGLDSGYLWAGDVNNQPTQVTTASFATTGSNTFTGDQTLIDAAGNAITISDASGSLMLVAKGFTSSSLHLSASAAGIGNLIFKTNSNTADTIISSSANIFINPAAPTAGFKRYMTGGNIAVGGQGAAVPQISGSMAWSPTIANNIFANSATPITYRGPVSASASTINNNVLAGGTINLGQSAANNFERQQNGLSMNGNILGGTLNAIAAKTPLSASSTIGSNVLFGSMTLNMDSSSVNANGNMINGGVIINNSALNSTLNTNAFVGFNTNNVNGGLTAYYSGSMSTFTGAPKTITNVMNSGTANVISASFNGDNSSVNSLGLIGQGLLVYGNQARAAAATDATWGGAFVGRWNAVNGNRAYTAETVFAVGTGTAEASRKTAFLIDSGSNVFVEGILNVSGSTTITGSLILSSSAAIELNVIGNSTFTGSVAGNVVSASITSNTASIDFSLGNYFEVTSSVTPLHLDVTNITPGRTSTLIVSASASSSITFSPNVAQPTGNAYSGSAGSIDILSLVAFNTSKVNLVATKALV